MRVGEIACAEHRSVGSAEQVCVAFEKFPRLTTSCTGGETSRNSAGLETTPAMPRPGPRSAGETRTSDG